MRRVLLSLSFFIISLNLSFSGYGSDLAPKIDEQNEIVTKRGIIREIKKKEEREIPPIYAISLKPANIKKLFIGVLGGGLLVGSYITFLAPVSVLRTLSNYGVNWPVSNILRG